jgi:hypothetical protein
MQRYQHILEYGDNDYIDIDNEDNMPETIDDNEYPEYPDDKC